MYKREWVGFDPTPKLACALKAVTSATSFITRLQSPVNRVTISGPCNHEGSVATVTCDHSSVHSPIDKWALLLCSTKRNALSVPVCLVTKLPFKSTLFWQWQCSVTYFTCAGTLFSHFEFLSSFHVFAVIRSYTTNRPHCMFMPIF